MRGHADRGRVLLEAELGAGRLSNRGKTANKSSINAG